MRSLEGDFVVRGALVGFSANAWVSGVVTFTETLLRPPLPFTKVRISSIRQCSFSNLGQKCMERKMGQSQQLSRSSTWYTQPLLPLREGLTQRAQIGWKPAPNQPKPLKRGSATKNLKDVL